MLCIVDICFYFDIRVAVSAQHSLVVNFDCNITYTVTF